MQTLKELLKEEGSWRDIMLGAEERVKQLQARKETIEKNLVILELKPKEISSEKEKLLELLSKTKKIKEESSNNLATTEKEANETNKALKLEEVKLADHREEKVRIEGIIATHNETLKQISERIKEQLNCRPENLAGIAEINISKPMPEIQKLENKLERLIQERERLGGVNLLAEQESTELEKKVTTLQSEYDDLQKAIFKLREGISQLNKEGRQRLLVAYGIVNENFQKLFNQLFAGGKAYIKLTDEADPLEAG